MEMESSESPPKPFDIGGKTSIVCNNMPESLLETNAAKKHFGQFGRVKKILLRPKKHGCVVEYDTRTSAEKALLNAGAYDGFMFDVTWNRKKKSISKTVEATTNKRSAREDDPDWVPDSDIEEELSAMSTVPVSRQLRQKALEQDVPPQNIVRKVQGGRATVSKIAAKFWSPARSNMQAAAATAPPTAVVTATSMTTSEAAEELHQLRGRVSRTADEQKRTLDTRDRILRAWGGTGSRVRAGGATIGTCLDLCPEKERLQRLVEHQVHSLECDSSGGMSAWRAVKQYSRSSADQETPMCYELRPPRVLTATMTYLLHEVADCTDSAQISLADWFHFMWDRLRSIRKDITQQALCCAESVRLVEQCARFHAHCAARLADLEHSQFDQRLNTDNLTKCLQTLKHMYADLPPSSKPHEAEFRAYIALLNLGDANFIWEIKQLPHEMQKSADITFAVQVFTALDNNNYVRFFRLVRDKATYLQACILLRYFNDVRARGLARIVKAFAPRGGSKYPIRDLLENLGFEDEESLKLFIIHYGLKVSKHEDEIDGTSVILDRNQFIEDSDPYPLSRAINLIESKRCCSVGEIIAGSPLPDKSIYRNHTVYCSFSENGTLKEASLLAEDLGYGTKNESNKDISSLKKELSRGPTVSGTAAFKSSEPKITLFGKPDAKTEFIAKSAAFTVHKASHGNDTTLSKFSFNPSIPVVSTEVFKSSHDKLFTSDRKTTFAFSKPDTWGIRLGAMSKPPESQKSVYISKSDNTVEASEKVGPAVIFGSQTSSTSRSQGHGSTSVFGETIAGSQNLFKTALSGVKPSGIFGSSSEATSDTPKNIFARSSGPQSLFIPSELVKAGEPTSIFVQKGDTSKITPSPFAPAVFQAEAKAIFGGMSNTHASLAKFDLTPSAKSLFVSAATQEGGNTQLPLIPENKVFNAAFGPLVKPSAVLVEDEQLKEQRRLEEVQRQQQQLEERRRIEEAKRLEEQRQQELRRQEELRMEEIRRQEEMRNREEEKRRQEELKRRLEEERRQAEIRRLAEEKRREEEEQRKTLERNRLIAVIEIESQELVEELTNEITSESVQDSTAREIEELKILVDCARAVANKLILEVSDEIIESEMAAEKLLSERLMAKYAEIWRANTARNITRRKLLDGTPVWLSGRNPQQAAETLRRNVLPAALSKMNDIHKGNVFSGKSNPEPQLEPYNIMEVVRTSLLKGLKRVKINYHSCFFWKVCVSYPGEGRWLNKVVDLRQWIHQKFSDNENSEKYPHCTYLKRDSWNSLMNFAISVCCSDTSVVTSLEGSNGLLFYSDENDTRLLSRIKDLLQHKRNRQMIPVVVITPNGSGVSSVQEMLRSLAMIKVISDFKIILLDPKDTLISLDKSTKTALKWLARNIPDVPPLEIDLLKSVLLRCVGMEFWYRLNLERHTSMDSIFKDANKLVELYNVALEKLRRVITDASIFEYPCFPNELKQYLQESPVLPKTYEFFPDDWVNEQNLKEIKRTLQSLRLQPPKTPLDPIDPVDFQKQVRSFCDEIDWFENPRNVSCKIISHLPRELSKEDVTSADFSQLFEEYDFLNMISIAVVEKINSMTELDGKYAIYDRVALTNVRSSYWWYETKLISALKHRAIDYANDEIDDALNESFSKNAKRMRLDDSDEILELDDKDESLVEESINKWSTELKKLTLYNTSMDELEKLLDKEAAKASNLEEMLRAALHD